MGETLTIPVRDLADTLDDIALFRDVERADLHDNMQRVYDASTGGVLTYSAGGRGSINQRQGHDAGALNSHRVARDRGSLEAGDLSRAVTVTTGRLIRERTGGHCQGEICSPTYWGLSAVFRALALRDTIGLLAHLPMRADLHVLAAELVTWMRIHRHLVRRLQAADGLVWGVGTRNKHHPKWWEIVSVLADRWERPVEHPTMRQLLDDLYVGKANRVAIRGHAALAARLYDKDTPFGAWLEEVTRETVPGRLVTPVGWEGDTTTGHFRAIMLRATAIPTSPNRGAPGHKPTRIVFEVDARGDGLPECETFVGHVPVGTVINHPKGAEIPKGWEIFGPYTPIPDIPEVRVAVGGGSKPDSGTKPTPARPPAPEEPADSEPDLLDEVRAWLERGDTPKGTAKLIPAILERLKGIRGVPK